MNQVFEVKRKRHKHYINGMDLRQSVYAIGNYAEQVLGANLQEGDVVICDGLTGRTRKMFHIVDGVTTIISQTKLRGPKYESLANVDGRLSSSKSNKYLDFPSN